MSPSSSAPPPLYPRAELDTYAFGHSVGKDEVLGGLARLARLQHLHRSGYWSSLTESKVEQSFVERVFGDVFGYTTLLGNTDMSHDVMPKAYVPLPGAARAFADFALGHFRADQNEIVVTAELKSPGADLDAQQSGNYEGKSPVQQAMMAASNAKAEWCVVSNANEVRLYRVPDEMSYERVALLDVLSPSDARTPYSRDAHSSVEGRPIGAHCRNSMATSPQENTCWSTHLRTKYVLFKGSDRSRLSPRFHSHA